MLTRDQQLVEKMLEGDEEAFDVFAGEQLPRLFRFTLPHVGGDRELAEEVVQTSLIQAIQSLHTYRGEAALFTWLTTFCRRQAGELMRRERRQPLGVPSLEDLPEVRLVLDAIAAGGSDLPDQVALRNEVAQLVRSTLDHLPSNYGLALEWRYLEGLAVPQIASRLNLTYKAAESLLSRARLAFRRAYSALAATLGGGETMIRESDA